MKYILNTFKWAAVAGAVGTGTAGLDMLVTGGRFTDEVWNEFSGAGSFTMEMVRLTAGGGPFSRFSTPSLYKCFDELGYNEQQITDMLAKGMEDANALGLSKVPQQAFHMTLVYGLPSSQHWREAAQELLDGLRRQGYLLEDVHDNGKSLDKDLSQCIVGIVSPSTVATSYSRAQYRFRPQEEFSAHTRVAKVATYSQPAQPLRKLIADADRLELALYCLTGKWNFGQRPLIGSRAC